MCRGFFLSLPNETKHDPAYRNSDLHRHAALSDKHKRHNFTLTLRGHRDGGGEIGTASRGGGGTFCETMRVDRGYTQVEMRKINRIIIHCTATPEGRHHTAADIDRWHRERGWSGIGYHFVIRLDGTVEVGRPVEKAGAHVRGHNADSIGVVYVGGCDAAMKPKDTRTDAQKLALRGIVDGFRKKYPHATVHGHNEFDRGKACPSFNVQTDL